jgi:F-type H+-transporting ATPase subunit a
LNFQAKYVLYIGNFKLSETVITSWILVALLSLLFYFLGRNLKKEPTSKAQLLVEYLINMLNGFVKQIMGERALQVLPDMIPYLGSLFVFFMTSNLTGLFGLRSPTADLDTTVAWSSITIVLLYYTALKTQGLSWFKGLAQPFILFLPMNILGEIARPISLSFRPFGNIAGGTIIMALIYATLGWISGFIPAISIPIGQFIIPVPLHIYFDVFSGVLQAFIFMMLTMVFVANEAAE